MQQQYTVEFCALSDAIEARYTDDGFNDPLEQLIAYEDQFETSAFKAEVTQYINTN